MNRLLSLSLFSALFSALALPIFGQGNYEVQVYPSETVKPGCTMVELHSNFTVQGSKVTSDGSFPTEHQLHETVEITHGVNEWFELGWYIFTSTGPNQGYKWVGDHIRPRVRVPEKWKWPVGASLSLEFGYQRPIFSGDTWSLEIRPIIDKQIGRWYMSFNPTFDRSFHGPGTRDGLVFSPNYKVGFDFSKKVQGGFEYYGVVGPFNGFFPKGEQEQQFVPVVDLNFSENWEFNFGVGVGVTHSTDHLLVKMILGYRFGKK
jgi:hypothetical protein